MATTYRVKEQLALSIDTQGDTGTASRLKIEAARNLIPITDPFAVRIRVCDDGAWADATNATIAVDSGYGTVITTHSSTKDLDIVSSSGSATGTLTISGVVIDGETATIGSSVYEFDNNASITEGNISTDISSYATASQGTLTVDTQPVALDAMSIGGKGYVFVADGTENTDGEISVGADLAGAKVNIVAAINGTDHNTANTVATAAAFSGDDCVVTAINPGTAGDAIATVENFTAVTNVFDAATLGTTTAGVDCTAANAVTALVAAVTGDGSAVVTAADGAGDTVDVTAVTAGTAGDSIASTETMANGAWGGATLSGGSVPSLIYVNLTDASAETVTVRLGPPALAGLTTEYYSCELDVTHAAP